MQKYDSQCTGLVGITMSVDNPYDTYPSNLFEEYIDVEFEGIADVEVVVLAVLRVPVKMGVQAGIETVLGEIGVVEVVVFKIDRGC